MRRGWPGLLIALIGCLALGACTATPITLPFADGAMGADAGYLYDAETAKDDLDTTKTTPDAGITDFGRPPGGDGTITDGLCLECPRPDGMADSGVGDAEAGPTTDALIDISVGDLKVGE